MIWQSGDSSNLPEGFRLLDVSISGAFTGDLNVGGSLTYFAIQYSDKSPSSLISGMPIIDDICLFRSSTNAEGSEEYNIIDKNINKGARGEKLYFGYHSRNPMGLCDLKYEYGTLDRYPLQVNKQYNHL